MAAVEAHREVIGAGVSAGAQLRDRSDGENLLEAVYGRSLTYYVRLKVLGPGALENDGHRDTAPGSVSPPETRRVRFWSCCNCRPGRLGAPTRGNQRTCSGH